MNRSYPTATSRSVGRAPWVGFSIVLTALLTFLLALGAIATPPGPNGLIIYTEDDSLHVVQPDGSGHRVVSEGEGIITRPDVSADGKSVLVVELPSIFVGEGPLVSVDLQSGSKTTVVAEDTSGGVWSSDGERVAFATQEGIFVSDGTSTTQVSDTHTEIFDWSPVDERILVGRRVGTGPTPDYYLETFDLNSRQATLIAYSGSGGFTLVGDADFSPDGQEIVYSQISPDGAKIVVAGQESGPIDSGESPARPNGFVAWSPDGSSLVYPTHEFASPDRDPDHRIVIYRLADGASSTVAAFADSVQWAPAAAAPPTGTFEDVPADHLFYEDIQWLAQKSITRGCNPPDNSQFCPTDFVTRAQMAAFLVRAFGYSDDGGGDLFEDDDGSIFETDIDRLATAGVTRGCNPPDNSQFCPGEFVTRAQMAAFLHRAFGDR